MTPVLLTSLPPSIQQLLRSRGFETEAQIEALLSPALSSLASPDVFSHMEVAVKRLLKAIQQEETIAIYADRDVDGLTGLAILIRSLRTLGAQVIWGSPLKGRGLDHGVLEDLASKNPKVMIFVDCGVGEDKELAWLASKEVDVIVADHHRLPSEGERPAALAYIHPGVMEGFSEEKPAGCVMAFKLAQALWLRFVGKDAARMDYFLFDHLDLLCLGILADRMPLVGENRIFVWHGLRRLAFTRKGGIASLMRFFRLLPRSGPVSVREASWQIIPLLNAAGRLGQPQWAANLLTTEDAYVARECIDQLLSLNTQRRAHQEKSVEEFERLALEQCVVETDSVIIVMTEGLEPSVTGLAAQSLARKYNRPAFLFVNQGEDAVGSGRGVDDTDLYALLEDHKEFLVRFGGHQGAVGLTLRMADFAALREKLLTASQRKTVPAGDIALAPEATLSFRHADGPWWTALQRLEPFGQGFPIPVFELTDVERILPVTRPRAKNVPEKSEKKRTAPVVRLAAGGRLLLAEFQSNKVEPIEGPLEGPWVVRGYAVAARKEECGFKWIIQGVRKANG